MSAKKTYAAFLVGLALLSGGCATDRIVAAPESGEAQTRIAVRPAHLGAPPLFIVDGQRVAREDNGRISSLNPNTIDNVVVLKGERAVRQYGPDGAHGVVVITTKAAAANR
jgi:outer membrane receptor for ferrienterochelin and colicin